MVSLTRSQSRHKNPLLMELARTDRRVLQFRHHAPVMNSSRAFRVAMPGAGR